MPASQNHRNFARSTLKLRQFEILKTVSEVGSILAAARQLNMTQPAVTKAVHAMEQHLGHALFTRTARGVIPTPEGEVIIRHARIILSEMRHAENELAALTEGHIGQVLVGTLLAAAPVLLPKAVARLKARQPGVHIRVIEATNDHLFPALQQGELDLVVGRQSANDPIDGLTREVLYHEGIRLVVGRDHPLAGSNASLADTLAFPWIMPLPQTSLRRQLERTFSDNGLTLPENTVESVSILMSRTLLTESDFIAALPEQAAIDDVNRGLLTFLPVDMPATLGPVGITIRDDRPLSRAAETLVACLRDVAQMAQRGS